MFLLSGYFIRKVPLKHVDYSPAERHFLTGYVHQVRSQIALFFKNKYLFLLTLGALLIATVEVLGASYYGFIIYKQFENVFLGGFLNIAVIFGVAIFASFLGPMFTKFLYRKTGLAPLFVFGTLLLAILPLTLMVNTYFFAVLAAVSCGVIGSSILGMAQGMLARKILSPSYRKAFFQSIELLMTVPFLIFVPLIALFTQLYGFTTFYYIVIVLLLGVVLPLYFGLVVVSNRKQL
jgi:MFS family permease